MHGWVSWCGGGSARGKMRGRCPSSCGGGAASWLVRWVSAASDRPVTCRCSRRMGDRLAVAKDKPPGLDLRARTGATAALPKLAASFLIFNLAHDNPAYCIFSYSRDKSLQLS
jgi:hypothetical protein